jgi:lysyl-tRNA synthetase class II
VEFFGSLKTHPSPQKASEQHKLKKKSLANVSSKGRIINQRQRGEARFASFLICHSTIKIQKKTSKKNPTTQV